MKEELQLNESQASLNTRHQDYTSVRDTKEELQKENQKLLTQLQSVEEREKRNVRMLFINWLNTRHQDYTSV